MTAFYLLKNLSKENMRQTKPSVFKAALLFFVITVILSLLVSYLSGYSRFLTNMNNIMAEVYSDPEMIENPTEEFLLELDEEIDLAMPKISPAAYLLIFIIIIMSGLITAGFEGYCLKVSRLEETKPMDIMMSFEHFGKAVLLLIIRFLTTFIGAMFFVLPGIIAYYSFSQCFMVMYDHPEYSAFKCLGESAKLMKKRKILFFSLQLSFIGWYFVESLLALPINLGSVIFALPVLSIYTKPYMGITYAHFYNSLAGTPGGYVPQEEPPQQ